MKSVFCFSKQNYIILQKNLWWVSGTTKKAIIIQSIPQWNVMEMLKIMFWLSKYNVTYMDFSVYLQWYLSLQVLCSWLSNNPNYEEITKWYLGWKGMLSEQLLSHPVIKEKLNEALDIMNRAVASGLGQSLFLTLKHAQTLLKVSFISDCWILQHLFGSIGPWAQSSPKILYNGYSLCGCNKPVKCGRKKNLFCQLFMFVPCLVIKSQL